MTAAYLDRILPTPRFPRRDVEMCVTVDTVCGKETHANTNAKALRDVCMDITITHKPSVARMQMQMPESVRAARADAVVDRQRESVHVLGWLLKVPHEACYGELDIISKEFASDTECRISLDPSADHTLCVGAVDLHLSRSAGASRLNAVLVGIQVYIGDRRVDALCGPDIETHVSSNAILRKDPRRWGFFGADKGLIVPLAMEPFYADDAAPCACGLEVRLQFREGTPRKVMESAALYGMKYRLSGKPKGQGTTRFQVTQRICPGQMKSVAIDSAARVTDIPLDFLKPGRYTALLFWGFDKACVTRVALTSSGRCVYDGSLAMLEYHKRASGLRELKACGMAFEGCAGVSGLHFDGHEDGNVLSIEFAPNDADASDDDTGDVDSRHVTVMAVPFNAECISHEIVI